MRRLCLRICIIGTSLDGADLHDLNDLCIFVLPQYSYSFLSRTWYYIPLFVLVIMRVRGSCKRGVLYSSIWCDLCDVRVRWSTGVVTYSSIYVYQLSTLNLADLRMFTI